MSAEAVVRDSIIEVKDEDGSDTSSSGETSGPSQSRAHVPVQVVITDHKNTRAPDAKKEEIEEAISRWSKGTRISQREPNGETRRSRGKSPLKQRSEEDINAGEDEFKHGETEKIRIGTDPETIRARDIQALKSRGMEWVPDESVSNCGICSSAFSVLSRRHHCRLCGKVFCRTCCSNIASFPYILNHNSAVRVCSKCYVADTLEAHTASVLSLCVLKSGELISTSADNTVRIWELMWGVDSSSGGMCVATLYGHTDDVTGVSPLSDSTLVSVSLDKTARLWFLETQAEGGLVVHCTGSLRSHSPIHCVTVIGDDIFMGNADGVISVWRLAPHDKTIGDCVAKFAGHATVVNCLVPYKDGSLLLSGSDDKSIRVWDVKSEACVGEITGHTGPVYSIADIPGTHGCIVSSSGDHTLRIWKLVTTTTKAKLTTQHKFLASLAKHTEAVFGVRIVKNAYIASCGGEGLIYLWSLETGKIVATFKGHTEGVRGLAVTAEGMVVSASFDKSLRVWRYIPPSPS